MNSRVMERPVAPRALRRPISLRRSVTTAIIVVDTPIMVSASTMTVMTMSRERSIASTPVSDWARRRTVWAWISGFAAFIASAMALSWSPSRAIEYSASDTAPVCPVSALMSCLDMYT